MCGACRSFSVMVKLFRPERSAMKRPTTTDCGRSVVCVSVCWTHGCAVQKCLNRSRCRLLMVWVQGNHVLDGANIVEIRSQPRSTTRRRTLVCVWRTHWLENVITAVVKVTWYVLFALNQYCQTENKQDTHRQALRQVLVLTVLLWRSPSGLM